MLIRTNDQLKPAKTPLESLMEMTARVRSKRRRSALPIRPSSKAEQQYRVQLQALVRKMASAVASEVMPIVRQEKANFVRDSFTTDSWADRIIAALAKVLASFTEGVFTQQAERLARSTVSMVEADTTSEFMESVNRAVGVDLERMITGEGIEDYIEIATRQNVQLIKSIPQEYFKSVENVVLGGMRSGFTPAKIAKDLQEQFGTTKKRAAIIARDQVAKLNSEINEIRQTTSGIQYFKSVDSNDNRVTGKPGGKYPNAKIKCYEIARQDIGYGPGVYKWSEGASYAGQTGLYPGRHHPLCRCTASPVFEWELPEKRPK